MHGQRGVKGGRGFVADIAHAPLALPGGGLYGVEQRAHLGQRVRDQHSARRAKRVAQARRGAVQRVHKVNQGSYFGQIGLLRMLRGRLQLLKKKQRAQD